MIKVEMEAIIAKINKEEQITTTVKKRSFIAEVDLEEDNHQFLLVDCFNDNCKTLDGVNTGDKVYLTVMLKGRIWKNENGYEKCFNSIKMVALKKKEN